MLGDPAGETRYRDSKGRPKVVRYWVMTPTPRADDVHAQPRGRRRCAGARVAEAGKLSDVRPRPQLLAECPTTCCEVSDRDLSRPPRQGRAAAATGRGTTTSARSRSRSGTARLDGIAERLADDGRRPAIVSSPFVRCRQSLDPLAQAAARARAVRRARPKAHRSPTRSGCSRRWPKRPRGALHARRRA